MLLDRWDAARFERAVQQSDPVDLRTAELDGHRPEQVVPLCHAVHEPAWRRWLAPAASPGRCSAPRVTVIIPTATRVPVGIPALLAQDEPVLIHVLWNGPGATPDIPGARVRRVAWRGHGATRQESLSHVETDLVMFLVDDATPLGAGFVRTLVEGLEGTGADAVWARQVPWPSASRRIRERLSAWCPSDGAAPVGRLDHVCALHRASILRKDPLDDVPIAEDWLWGRRHVCALVAGAPVLHSHPAGLRRSYARTRDIHRVLRANGEPAVFTGLGGLFRALPRVLPDRDGLGELLGQWAAG